MKRRKSNAECIRQNCKILNRTMKFNNKVNMIASIIRENNINSSIEIFENQTSSNLQNYKESS